MTAISLDHVRVREAWLRVVGYVGDPDVLGAAVLHLHLRGGGGEREEDEEEEGGEEEEQRHLQDCMQSTRRDFSKLARVANLLKSDVTT